MKFEFKHTSINLNSLMYCIIYQYPLCFQSSFLKEKTYSKMTKKKKYYKIIQVEIKSITFKYFE